MSPDYDRYFRLSRLVTDDAKPVCGATPSGSGVSVKMRRCVLKPHGTGVEHVDQDGMPFGGRLTPMQRTPERRR